MTARKQVKVPQPPEGGERTAERGREDGEAVSKSDLDAIEESQ